MFASVTVLFSLLAALVGMTEASPLPMPALKQSGDLAARFYNHHYRQPVYYDGTPCWHGGRFGYLKDRNCALIDADVDVGLLKRHGGLPFADGQPCWNDDKFGSIDGAVCVAADVDIAKRSYAPYPYGQPVWLDGTPCWNTNQFGYLKDRTCSIVNIDLDISILGLGGRGRDYYYAHRHPYFVDGTPCWADQRFGYIRDGSCGILDVDADLNILKRGGVYTYDAWGRPVFADNSPCYDNGRFGYFRDALCVVADIDVDVDVAKRGLVREPVWTDGTPCWRKGHFGYIKDRSCALVDAEIQVGLKKRAFYPELVDGEACWDEDRFGHISNGACLIDLDVDVSVEKRLLGGNGDGLVGGLLGGPSYRFANSHPGNVPPPKPLLGVAGLKKRNGILHNSPGGSGVDSALHSVNQLLDHSVTKRHILTRPGYYDDDDVIADIAASADLGNEHHRGGLGALGLKKKRGMAGLDGVTGLVGGNKGQGQGRGKGQGGPVGGLTGLLG